MVFNISLTFDSCGPYKAEWVKWERNLQDSPVTFELKLNGDVKRCSLSFQGKEEDWMGRVIGEYVLTIEDVLASDLSKATPITMENIPDVCRSDVLAFKGKTITRVSWILFLKGSRISLTAVYNERLQTGILYQDGKILFQFSCEDPSECPDLPYFFTK